MSIGYDDYRDFVRAVVESKHLGSFKQNPIYNGILEHVSKQQGLEYYLQSINEFHLTNEIIRKFCILNDSLGNPKKEEYPFGTASPSSLRYVYFANRVLSHMKKLNISSKKVVEIGGGYGGLAFALLFFSNTYGISIQSYTVVDIDVVTELQKLYLKTLPINDSIFSFYDALTYGKDIQDDDLYLIATYSFSELDKVHRDKYAEILLPKTSHGFFAWNYIPVYDLGKNFHVEMEKPVTHEKNRYVFF